MNSYFAQDMIQDSAAREKALIEANKGAIVAAFAVMGNFFAPGSTVRQDTYDNALKLYERSHKALIDNGYSAAQIGQWLALSLQDTDKPHYKAIPF